MTWKNPEPGTFYRMIHTWGSISLKQKFYFCMGEIGLVWMYLFWNDSWKNRNTTWKYLKTKITWFYALNTSKTLARDKFSFKFDVSCGKEVSIWFSGGSLLTNIVAFRFTPTAEYVASTSATGYTPKTNYQQNSNYTCRCKIKQER